VRETSKFRRGQHLVLAVLSLVTISEMSLAGWRRAEVLGATWPWDGADVLLFHATSLLLVVVLAWLAFAVIDTRSDVKLIAPGWWKLGWEPWVVFAGLLAVYVGHFYFGPHDAVVEHAQTYFSFFHDEFSGIEWGWLVASTVVAALTEELVFRGFLQRALEGYIGERPALFVQAVVFQLVHVHVYGVGAGGGINILNGLVFGMAFMRTRTIVAPLVLHAGGNLIHAAVYMRALD
jgi:membrane protease YdiL (CAAX protease family)